MIRVKFEDFKKNSTQITIGIICFLFLFMLTVQIRTISRSESDILRLKNENELRNEIEQWKDIYKISTTKIDELNTKIDEYRTAASKSSESTALIKKELDIANMVAGYTNVKGQGIAITLDDTKAIEKITLDAGYYDPNVFVIHDSDILLVINELRAAGAEAISINGHRVTGRSEIRCVGPVISVNGAKIAAPFEILAIGEADNLSSAFSLRGGIVDNLRQADISIDIEKREELIIPKSEKVVANQYATVVEESE